MVDELRMQATVVDKATGPLRNITNALAGASKAGGGSVKGIAAELAAFERTVASAGRTVANTFAPALSAIGIGAGGAAAGLAGLMVQMKKFAERAVDLKFMSEEIGLGVRQLKEFQTVASALRIAPERAAQGLQVFGDKMFALRHRTAQANEMFQQFARHGIAPLFKELQGDAASGDVAKALRRSIDAMSRIKDPQVRGVLAEMIFGSREFARITTDQYTAMLRALNPVLADNSAEAMKLHMAMEKSRVSVENLATSFNGALAPAITEASDELAKFMRENEQGIGRGLLAFARELANFFRDAKNSLDSLRQGVTIDFSFRRMLENNIGEAATDRILGPKANRSFDDRFGLWPGAGAPPAIPFTQRYIDGDALRQYGERRAREGAGAGAPALPSPSPQSAIGITPNGEPIHGAASTYNPFKPGWRSGGPQTASGETYDPAAYTAAIQTGLRDKFGGVGYGGKYKPAFAMVEHGGKRLIVRVNDVGPLTPGRVIDLNEASMRHFDPTGKQGVLQGVKVTPLQGGHWTPGPVADAPAGGSWPRTLANGGAGSPRSNFMRGQFGPPGSNLTTIETPYGKITVNRASADAFGGFIGDLHKAGAPIKSIGSYALRNIAGSGTLSQHAYGNALDLDQSSRNVIRRELREWIERNPDKWRAAVAKWGMVNGGDWRSPDWGHVEWNGTRPWDAAPRVDGALARETGVSRVTGDARITVDVNAPKGTKVGAEASGLFKNIELNRSSQMTPAGDSGDSFGTP